MREIVLDTETTGLSPNDGHRIVEIGCVELENHVPTGKTFHTYVNPERDVPRESTRITGLTESFLRQFRPFNEIMDPFLDFIQDDILIIHNAQFDQRFLTAELTRYQRPILSQSRIVDTLAMARKKFPGSPASLDALCKRFKIDLGERTHHGALLDARLLASVYIELIGGRQRSFMHAESSPKEEESILFPCHFPRRSFPLDDDSVRLHCDWVNHMGITTWKAV
jgi:DNA polymerase-3 subunit epsilon